MNSLSQSTFEHFEKLANTLFAELKHNEELNLNLKAEDQTYLRFNNSLVRQSTKVEQKDLYLCLQNGNRKVDFSTQLTGQLPIDIECVRSLLTRMREELQSLPEDPFVVPMQNFGSSRKDYAGNYLSSEELMKLIAQETAGTQFTGLYAAGPQILANRNSKGQSHWFSTDSFFLDYSLFTVNSANENKAVKGCYTEKIWNKEDFLSNFQTAKNQLSLLQRPSKKINPGNYRTYLAPDAALDVFGMLNWGALSFAAYKRGNCAFGALYEGRERLSEKLTVTEDFSLGVSPQFNSLGEVAPDQMMMIENGKLKNFLVNARTAKEYNVQSNGADQSSWFGEYLRSGVVSAGQLKQENILKELRTGIYISNVHYLNWSDVPNARLTGMTRYACFWVENGEISAPIQDMRFDESLYRILGSELIDLTETQAMHLEVDTYFRRALGGRKNPGLLLNEFRLTL